MKSNTCYNFPNQNITQLVGYFKSPHSNLVHLFFRWGQNSFHWGCCDAFYKFNDIKMAPGVKIFSQEPEIELYQAKTWEDAKKWFENPQYHEK